MPLGKGYPSKGTPSKSKASKQAALVKSNRRPKRKGKASEMLGAR